jgi:excisionase family DNA binding protein
MELLTKYPDVLTVSQLKEILQLGKNKTYKLLQNGTISSIKIGNDYRITKKSLLDYLENQK